MSKLHNLPRPTRAVKPSVQLPSAFRFGYDPYNTVHAHLIAIRVSWKNTFGNLRRYNKW